MLIVCPTCAKSYHIARTSLGDAGRSVQCSKCFSRWHCAPGGVVVAPPEADPFAPEIITRTDRDLRVPSKSLPGGSSTDAYEQLYNAFPRQLAKAPALARRSRSAALQVAAAAAVLVLAMGAVAAREALVLRLPQLAYAFAAIGLPVNIHGIAFGPVHSALVQDGGNAVLSVEGSLTNLRAGAVKVPEIVASLKGADGHEVYTWTSTAPKTTLGPGETATFRTRLAAPPANAQNVVLRFASADDAVPVREKLKK